MIISLNTAFDLKIFSPSEPIGIFIIFVGLIFTGMIFYIIYAVSTNKESLEDKKIRTKRTMQHFLDTRKSIRFPNNLFKELVYWW